jgi:hypothetical protein
MPRSGRRKSTPCGHNSRRACPPVVDTCETEKALLETIASRAGVTAIAENAAHAVVYFLHQYTCQSGCENNSHCQKKRNAVPYGPDPGLQTGVAFQNLRCGWRAAFGRRKRAGRFLTLDLAGCHTSAPVGQWHGRKLWGGNKKCLC